MRRRAIIAAATLAPLAAGRAQQARLPRVGVLILDNVQAIQSSLIEALRNRGLEDGRTATMEFRFAGGVPARLDQLAAELVRLPVDVLIAWQTQAAQAARRATSSIPIVMLAADPVGTGLVASLTRPGGNVTGFAALTTEFIGKSIELMVETLPGLRRLGALINGPDPWAVTLLGQIRRSAASAGLVLHEEIVGGTMTLDAAVAAIAAQRVDAVFVHPSLPHAAVIELARRHRLAVFSVVRGFAEAGGLLAYTGSRDETVAHVAAYAERVLKGARPADLPVVQPTRFELLINLAAARALGIAVPPAILARADEVIE